MNAPVNITNEPEILRLTRSMDDLTKHKVLQLIIREFGYAEEEADIFLTAAAAELFPVGEDDGGHHWSEGAAVVARDDLYPFALLSMEASRHHRMRLERDVLAAERRVNGRAAMMGARPAPIADPAYHGSVFGG